MKKITRRAAIAVPALLAAVAGATVVGVTAQASSAADPAPGDVYKASIVRSFGQQDTHIVGLALPAGSYTVTASVYVQYADRAWCSIGSRNMATPYISGYNEGSLSATDVVTLAAPGTVWLTCSSTRALPVPQDPAANATLVATRDGVVIDQGHGAQ